MGHDVAAPLHHCVGDVWGLERPGDFHVVRPTIRRMPTMLMTIGLCERWFIRSGRLFGIGLCMCAMDVGESTKQ